MVAKLDGTNGLLQQYDYQAPTTGFSYTFAAGVNVLVMNPAGTLATGTITMPASPADGMTISFSSTQTITALTVNANTGQSIVRKPTSFGAGSAMTFVYRLSNTTWYPMTNYATAGTVLQVVSTNYNTRTSFTSTTSLADITGMSVTITPTSNTSKIFVLATLSFNAPGGQNVFCILDRNGTRLAEGATGEKTFIGMATANSNNYWMLSASNSFLDSPASTSALTYKLQARTAASTSTWVINGTVRNDATDPNGSSTITVMEIAA